MPALIAPPCPTCGRRDSRDVREARLPWAQVTGFGNCVAWLDGPADRLRTAAPAAGTEADLAVDFPFRAAADEPFWAVFEPEDAAWEGAAQHPHLLDKSALVRCVLVADLGRFERAWPLQPRPAHQLRVRVLETIALSDLPRAFAPASGEPFGPAWSELVADPRSDCYGYGAGDLRCFEVDREGGTGALALVCEGAVGPALVLYAEWGNCHDFHFCAGHRPLGRDAYAALDARFARL